MIQLGLVDDNVRRQSLLPPARKTILADIWEKYYAREKAAGLTPNIGEPKCSRRLRAGGIHPAIRGSCLDVSTRQHVEPTKGEFNIPVNHDDGVQRI